MITDTHNAFVATLRVPPTGQGALDGLTFAVKDLIDVAGTVTGAGNPDWARAHAPASHHADCVTPCLNAGATIIGKTITDELAFSLEGVNGHFGTPINPQFPDALPGGSSSGSAVAVAAGAADFALGTDTGGSVRIPGAFCGLWSIRPTHGRISLSGVTPFAPSLDTAGWFATSADTLLRVGVAILQAEEPRLNSSISFAQDTLELCDTDVTAAATAVAQMCSDRAITVADRTWPEMLELYQTVQNADIRAALGAKLAAIKTTFCADIAERFDQALIPDPGAETCNATRAALTDHLENLVAQGCILLPTSPVLRLPVGTTGAPLGEFYGKTLAIGALAGLAGLPQVQFPLGPSFKYAGMSLIGARGTDLALIRLADTIAANMQKAA